MIAEVIINITAKRLQQTFSYLIPAGLEIHVGSRVLVPFGYRKEEGIVVSIHQQDEGAERPDYTLKPILSVLSEQAGFREEMIKTALWISQYYLCNISDALRLFMIEKKGIITKKSLSLRDIQGLERAQRQDVIAYFSKRASIDKNTVIKQFGKETVETLINGHLLQEDIHLQNKVADKKEEWLYFLKADTTNTLKSRRRQSELLAELEEKGCDSVAAWVKRGYSRSVINNLCSSGLAKIEERLRSTMDLTEQLAADTPWDLTDEQKKAIETIESDTSGKTYVLHGVTGSGKTEIYMDLAKKVVALGKQVIILVPEIALTGQIVRRFIRRFGNDIVIMHSQLSKGERRNNWLRMVNKESHICIGARSAVFTAVADLGLVIVDEAHDSSYKQDETPRYHAVNVARKRAAYYGCPVILGSATPSLESYYKARQGEYVLIELKKRVEDKPLPSVEVVDMREELAHGNKSVLSDSLTELLETTLQENHQAIILLNRRGFSTFIMCRKCGYVIKCKTCDVAMVYHKGQNNLRCHYCDAEAPVPEICPECGSKYIKFFGTGTEKVEEQLKRQFPQARIVRLDQDTTAHKSSGDHIIEAFRRHEYDILLGTQMVAKGHDFPEVSAVGILSADSLLNLPVYWAGERTFQLLTQAAGRSGRGSIPGKVVMQTYAPEHYVIICSQNQDYQAFYEKEITYRKELLYPPFHQLIKIMVTSEDESYMWQQGNSLAQLLNGWQSGGNYPVEIIGPYVDTIKKIRNKYRIVILIKGPDLQAVKKYIKGEAEFCKTGIIIDVDPSI
jgi:primosomal protein N' (replication factor Y)